MIYDFCFVISDMLSTTPRAYRSIKTLLENNYSIFLIFNERIPTAKATNTLLIKELKNYTFDYKCIVWKKWSIKTLFFKIIHKIIKSIAQHINFKNPYLLAFSNDFPTVLQLYYTKKTKAKIYAGHRPAVLPAIVLAAKKNHANTWFDIEDYHCEESLDAATNLRMQHFTSCFQTNHYTNASELIGKAYLEKNKIPINSIELLNSPIDFDYSNKLPQSANIRFFWFSQYVAFNRGLEFFFDAIKELPINYELHIVGNVYDNFRTYVEQLNIENLQLKYYGFIPESKINALAQSCDFGLALERSDADSNKNLAISNKILTYAVAGCYIIASNTSGQLNFMKRLPLNGIVIEQNTKALRSFLSTIPENINNIRQNRQKRIDDAKIVSWNEQKKILHNFVSSIL